MCIRDRDNSQPDERFNEDLLEKIADRKIITILNKCDLPAKFETGKLPDFFSDTVQISAEQGTGIEKLLERIRQVCGVTDFVLKTAVCFTNRQENLLNKLTDIKSKQQAASIITELLNGQLRV